MQIARRRQLRGGGFGRCIDNGCGERFAFELRFRRAEPKDVMNGVTDADAHIAAITKFKEAVKDLL